MPEQPVRRQLPGWREEWKFYYSITENLKSQQQSGTKTDIATDWDYVWPLALCRRGFFSVTKPSVFTWGDWASVWNREFRCWQGSVLAAEPDCRLGAPSAVLSPCAPSASRSWEQRAWGTLGTVPTGLAETQAGTQQLLSLTCHSPQNRWKLCLLPSSRHSDTAQPGSELWHKAKDKFLWQLQFPKKLGGRRGQGKQTGKFSLVYSVCLSHIHLTHITCFSHSLPE